MSLSLGLEYESAGAVFDPERLYRYSLHRMWSGSSQWRTMLWVMLNPSTADEHVLDPTLRRVETFTRAAGLDGFAVVNLFALRSPYPRTMLQHLAPVGPGNDQAILEACHRADRVVVAWGKVTHPAVRARANAVLELLRANLSTSLPDGPRLWCLGMNVDDSPRHPLYLPNATTLRQYAISAT